MSEEEAINRLVFHMKETGLDNETAIVRIDDVQALIDILEEKEKVDIKKDKIIIEMAKAFKQDDIRSVNEIIRYFEEKLEKEEYNGI